MSGLQLPGGFKALFLQLSNLRRGFAFVDFATKQEAKAAVEAVAGTHLYGRRLVRAPRRSHCVFQCFPNPLFERLNPALATRVATSKWVSWRPPNGCKPAGEFQTWLADQPWAYRI